MIRYPAYNGFMDPLHLLKVHRDAISALCRHYGVERLRVFGSALSSEWNEETSDFDFLAEFGPTPEGINRFDQQFGFQVDLEQLLGRPVDVVDWNAAKKPWFREAVDREAQVLYAA